MHITRKLQGNKVILVEIQNYYLNAYTVQEGSRSYSDGKHKFCIENTVAVFLLFNRQTGQDTAEEVRGRDFRKDLEERERQAARERNKEKGSRSTTEQPKRPRLDQPPPSNLDADDPVDDDDDDDSDER